MTFEELGYFVELSKSLNFTKAADRLFISQPSLSRHIANLEESLGAQLMVRTKRSVQLTEAGQYLAREGEKLLTQKSSIEDTIWQMGNAHEGKLTIATISSQWIDVYTYCRQFQMAYPQVRLILQQQPYGSSLAEISSGAADCVICNSYEVEFLPENVDSRIIGQSEFRVIVPEDHRLAKKNIIYKADLAGEKWLMSASPQPTNFCTQVHIALGAVIPGQKIPDASHPRTLEAMVMQVRAGLGIGLLPTILCRSNDGYVALPLADVDTKFDIAMYWMKTNINPALEGFKDIVDTELSNHSLLILN